MDKKVSSLAVSAVLIICILFSAGMTGCGKDGAAPPVAVSASPSSTVAQQVTVQLTPASQQTPVTQQIPVSQQTPVSKKTPVSQQSANNSGKTVDLVICLDTSNSMDQLIASAKQKLWDIVNTVSTLKPTPVLRVALLSYGNTGYGQQTGWVRMDTDFTTDLDLVNEKLFSLSTNGGTEYVARVLSDSLHKLSWQKGKDSLRLIYVAGNENANQDRQLSIKTVCQEARQYDTVVNAIFCGDQAHGDRLGWREVATLGGGSFFAIDQARGVAVIKTPYDEKLATLSNELNGTYVAYGQEGQKSQARQSAQDSNAAGMSMYAAASRAEAKSSGLYNNKGWDLVDAKKDKSFKLESVRKEELPAEMQTMNTREQEEYVSRMSEKRNKIQKEIQDISQQRKDFLKKAEQQKPAGGTLDSAIVQSITDQAKKKGLTQ
jgi:hypothetical protein